MTSENPALAALRQATHQVHHNLEQRLHIASGHAGRCEYMAYIAALWGWLCGFEQALWRAAWPLEVQAARRAEKCMWLMQDLRQGGLDDAAIARLPVSDFRPDLTSLPARFGAAYVIEGAQLGTQVLRKRLGPALAPWSPRWLEGYGPDLSANWKAFLASMQQHLESEECIAAAARSAVETFESLAIWLRMQSVAKSV